jgi:hypothetical protein
MAPTTNPMIKVHRIPIVPSKVGRRYTKVPVGHL